MIVTIGMVQHIRVLGHILIHTQTVDGCDSTATLNLTINNSSSSSEDVVACDSYDWNGSTYTSSGSYTYSILKQ